MTPTQTDLAHFAEGGIPLSSRIEATYELLPDSRGPVCPGCKRYLGSAGIYSVEWRGRICWNCLQQNARPVKSQSPAAPMRSDITPPACHARPDYSSLPSYHEMKLIDWREYRPAVLDEARLIIASIDLQDEGISRETIVAALERIVGRAPPLDIVRNAMCAIKAVLAADGEVR